MKKVLFTAILGLLLIAGTAIAQDEPANPGASANLMTTLRSQAEFASFVRLIEHAGLHGEFSGPSLTVFAPTNGALAEHFDALAALSPNSLELMQFVRSYLVAGQHVATDLADMALVQSLAGNDLDVSIGSGEKSVASSKVTNENIEVDEVRLAGAALEASNGIIYPLEKLFPSSLEYVN